MSHRECVLRAPGTLAQRAALADQLFQRRIDGSQQRIVPIRITRIEHVGRTLGDQLPQRAFELRRR